MGFTKDEMEKAERNGKVENHIKRNKWKEPITNILKKQNKFLNAKEIRELLKAKDHIYQHLHYLKLSGSLATKIVDNKVYYGLKEWK